MGQLLFCFILFKQNDDACTNYSSQYGNNKIKFVSLAPKIRINNLFG